MCVEQGNGSDKALCQDLSLLFTSALSKLFVHLISLKKGCIEFIYYADAIHSGLTPPG